MILVTGSRGFIGKHLMKLDNTIGMDLPLDINKYLDLMRFDGCEGIIHCAAISRVSTCNQNSKEAIKVNILGTDNIIDYCKLNNIWLIYISTREANNPKNFYGFTKFCAEELCLISKIPCTILRLNDVYGEGNNPDKIIPRILRNEEIELTDPNMLIDPLPVEKAVEAIKKAIEEPKIGEIINVTGEGFITLKDFYERHHNSHSSKE
jgi:nucleoside-diphosphate-sugar epimerase